MTPRIAAAARKAGIPVAIVAGAGVVTVLMLPLLDHSQQYLYDRRMGSAANEEVSDRLMPVAIDDDSTDHLGRWPWARGVTAALARDLASAGARAVLLDITYNDRTDPAQDQQFVDTMAGVTPAVAAVSVSPLKPSAQVLTRFSEEKRRAMAAFEERIPVAVPGAEEAFPAAFQAWVVSPPLADFLLRGPGVGVATVREDSDGVLRRSPLLWRDGRSTEAGSDPPRWIPSLALAVACRWYGVAPSSLRAEPGALILPGAKAPGDPAPHEVRIPVDPAAALWVNYAPPGVIAAHFIGFHDLQAGLASTDPRGRPHVRDRIAIVYQSNTGSGDMHSTPLAKAFPGGLFNAEVLNTILTQRWVRIPPGWSLWVIGILEGALLAFFAARWTSYRLAAAVLGLLSSMVVSAFLLYRFTAWMVPLVPFLVLGGVGGAAVVFWRAFLEDRERIDLMFTLRALQNQALKERRGSGEILPDTARGSTDFADATDALKRNVEYGRFIESLRDIDKLQNAYIGKHYRLLNLIDEGGMGLVFRAHDEALDRIVAIKVLTRYSAKLLKRFQTEAKAVGQLHHPNVVQVFAVAAEGDIPYIVMEYVQGISLSQRIRDDGPLPIKIACDVILQVARGLDAAHVRQIIHRDVKTSNILLTPQGTAKIIDFGIAKVFQSQPDGEGLTGEKEIVGTADYMSPEQGSGRPVDLRSDIYSLGITFYRVLTGRLPFRAEDTVAVLLKQMKEPLPDLRALRADVPDSLVHILNRMTEKKPENRYQSCKEICLELEEFLAPGSV